MTAAVFVRVCLVRHRQDGLPFAMAWSRAIQSLPRAGGSGAVESQRAEDVAALKWARPAWEAAYVGAPEPALRLTAGGLELADVEQLEQLVA